MSAAAPNGIGTEDEEEFVTELTNFDIPQVHLVDDPANGRRILTRKGVAMGAPPPKKENETEPGNAAGGGEGAAADAGAATGEEPKKPAPAKAMKLAAPIRGAMLATLQGMGERVAKLMQAVDGAEPSEEMTVPSELQEAFMGIQQDMDVGMQPFQVAKRRVVTPVNNFFRSLLDTYNKALDHLPLSGAGGGVPAGDAGAVADAAAASAPQGTSAAIEAVVTKAVKPFEDKLSEVTKSLADKDATIKSLQSELHALRRSPAASSVVNVGGAAKPAAKPGLKSPQEFADLNKYREYLEKNQGAAG